MSFFLAIDIAFSIAFFLSSITTYLFILFFSEQIVNYVILGRANNKMFYIVTNKEKEVIDFLNSEIDTSYKANSKQIVKLIKRLIELGFTVSDFKKVILNKKRCWKGTDYEIYLRPSTLFRESKFEEYLNEKEKINKVKNEVRSIYDIYKPFS